MDWSLYLEAGEKVQWEGRPAPRCFTFRNWPHSLFGFLVLGMSIYWLYAGLSLGSEYDSAIFVLLPVPFILIGAYLAVGHLVLARLEWEKVFYAVTQKRLIVLRGLLRPRQDVLALDEITYFSMKNRGEALGNFRISCTATGQQASIPCVEHPEELIKILEKAVKRNLGADGAGEGA